MIGEWLTALCPPVIVLVLFVLALAMPGATMRHGAVGDFLYIRSMDSLKQEFDNGDDIRIHK